MALNGSEVPQSHPCRLRPGRAVQKGTMGDRATPPEEGCCDAMADKGQGWTGEQQSIATCRQIPCHASWRTFAECRYQSDMQFDW